MLVYKQSKEKEENVTYEPTNQDELDDKLKELFNKYYELCDEHPKSEDEEKQLAERYINLFEKTREVIARIVGVSAEEVNDEMVKYILAGQQAEEYTKDGNLSLGRIPFTSYLVRLMGNINIPISEILEKK